MTEHTPATPVAETTTAAPEHAPAGSLPEYAPAATLPPVATPQKDHAAFAISSFVLGIASFVSSWTFFAPLIGLILGAVALRRGTSERTLALWGVWLNAIMLALTVLAILLFFVLGGIGLLAALSQAAG